MRLQVELQHLYNRQLNICHNRFCTKIYPSFFLQGQNNQDNSMV